MITMAKEECYSLTMMHPADIAVGQFSVFLYAMSSHSLALPSISFMTFAGTPAATELNGISYPSRTTAPAPISTAFNNRMM